MKKCHEVETDHGRQRRETTEKPKVNGPRYVTRREILQVIINGTSGTRTSAVRTPISRASWSVAGRDHENFATNRSFMTALDERYSGNPCPHFSSSRRSPAGPIADAKSAATTRPRAAGPTCGNSLPLGRASRGSSAQIRPLCAACRNDQAILEEAPSRRSARAPDCRPL